MLGEGGSRLKTLIVRVLGEGQRIERLVDQGV